MTLKVIEVDRDGARTKSQDPRPHVGEWRPSPRAMAHESIVRQWYNANNM